MNTTPAFMRHSALGRAKARSGPHSTGATNTCVLFCLQTSSSSSSVHWATSLRCHGTSSGAWLLSVQTVQLSLRLGADDDAPEVVWARSFAEARSHGFSASLGLSRDIRAIRSLPLFKSRLRIFLFTSAYD
ncbi:unnamed protein product [Lampetra fluviatilis]